MAIGGPKPPVEPGAVEFIDGPGGVPAIKSSRCPICTGLGTISLTVYDTTPQLSDFDDDADPVPSPTMRKRRFPCPECAGSKQMSSRTGEKFSIIRVSHMMQDIPNPGYQDSIQKTIAARIARSMVDQGLVIFEERANTMSYSPRESKIMEGVVGVMWPKGQEFSRLISEDDDRFGGPSRPTDFDRGGRTVPGFRSEGLMGAAQAKVAAMPKSKLKPVAPKKRSAFDRDIELFEDPDE